MVVDNKFERCSEDDPSRCQGLIKHGQCPFKSMIGTKYCAMHGGIPATNAKKAHALANYRLQQYGERVADFANNSEIKSLREEIGIVRLMLEGYLNSTTDINKLLIYSDKISNMVGQIQRLVETSQKMEERNNNLLDRKIVIVIADSIVTLVGQYITDPDQLTEIGTRICESISSVASPLIA